MCNAERPGWQIRILERRRLNKVSMKRKGKREEEEGGQPAVI
jgi:hypothetical protein